ncbi:hypothetical protein BOTBODRAFT_628063 [Botryobasidium botryosum FD-172 SS1]|uniref:Uncharacterized protein n=1 Tax=Botryobasidium botryosum (strain FD-172 SS1) TaxID=930990 RepID=A0A067MGE0_BOTB1|nr:hypothetical protein BOTBODRAFT_628063 [Botryobasidium botryosum FD-172 SS1]
MQPRTSTTLIYIGKNISMPDDSSLPTLPDGYGSLSADVEAQVDRELCQATVSKVRTLAAERHLVRNSFARMPHRDALGALYTSTGKRWDEGYSRLRFWLAKLQAA